MPNTVAYTTTKSASVTATVSAGTGERASAVSKMPVAIHGCLPISVTNQPATIAMKPSGHAQDAAVSHRRFANSVPRHHSRAADEKRGR